MRLPRRECKGLAQALGARPRYGRVQRFHAGARLAERISEESEKPQPIAGKDPRLDALGHVYYDEFANVQDGKLHVPKNPIVLCHGLFGFDKVEIGQYSAKKPALITLYYWLGIREALEAAGAEVLVTHVKPTASVSERASELALQIEEHYPGRAVNLVGHSMGGLDCRHLICQKPTSFSVSSLTTIATPHHGSPFADLCLSSLGEKNYKAIERVLRHLGVDSIEAFTQLTTTYLRDEFNPANPDDATVRYYSYGAVDNPSPFSPFYLSWLTVYDKEGPNDGVVSAKSAAWGDSYRGTLYGVNHIEVQNWVSMWEAWFTDG